MSRLSCILLFVFCGTAFADPATRPATQPKQISLWLTRLADLDPARRNDAERSLMSLSRDELSELVEAVRIQRPLQPSQVAALHEIVTEVFLQSEDYVSAPNAPGFLGMQLPTFDDSEPGVRVVARYPGFPAFLALRDGDRILSINDQANAPLMASTFQTTISKFRGGDVVTLHIVRDGHRLEVDVCLKPRPRDIVPDLDSWLEPRFKEADDFWNEHFAAVVGEPQT